MQKLFAPLVLFLSACSFTPEGEYFKEIPRTDPIDIISLSDYDNEDTIRIYQATEFEFAVSSNMGNILEVNVLLDDQSQPVYFTDVNKGSFKFENSPWSYSNLRSGTYDLKITFTHSSGTGSLADKKGTEIVDVWKKWTLIIDVDPPPEPVVNFSEENGYLKLSWAPFSKPSFQSYTIDIYMEDWYKKKIAITDPTQTYWIDSAYVTGLRMKYYVSVITVNAQSYSSAEFTVPNNVTIDYNASDSSAYITWNKPRFYKGFKSYELRPSFDESPTTITDINDTTRLVKFKKVIFGSSLGASLTVNPVNNYYWPFNKYVSVENPCNAKEMWGFIQDIRYDAIRDNILVHRYDRICFYNASLAGIDSVALTTSSSSLKGNFIYSHDQTSVISYDLSSKTQNKIDVTTEPNYRTGPWNVQGAANGRVSYGYVIGNGPYGYVENIYDFSTHTLIYTKSINQSNSNIEFTNPALSIDGQYAFFYKDKSIYKINTDGLQFSGTLPSNGYMIGFRDDNTDELLFRSTTGNSIEIRSSSDASLKRTISSPGSDVTFQGYDPGSKYILFGTLKGDDIYFVHIDTGEIRHINAFTNTYGYYPYKLVGGYLFDNDHTYIKIF